MKNIFFFLMTFSGLMAFAATPTKYEQLISNFEQGQLPSKREIQGAWSGRCFFAEYPNVEYGSILVADFVTQGSTTGSGVTSFNLAIHELVQPPDRFDAPSDELRNAVRYFKNGAVFKSLVATEKDDSLEVNNEAGNLIFKVRKYKTYFVAKGILIKPYQNYDSGFVWMSCYFYNKVF